MSEYRHNHKTDTEPNYNKRRAIVGAVAGTALALAGYGAHEAISTIGEKTEQKPVATAYASLEQNQTVIQAVSEALDGIAVRENIDRNELPSGVEEANQAASTAKSLYDEKYNQPGELYEVQVTKNGFDDYAVSVDVVDSNETVG